MGNHEQEMKDIAPEIRALYEKGAVAVDRKNYDYAIELFNQALALQQDFALARHGLHLAHRKKREYQPLSGATISLNRIKAQAAGIRAALHESKRHLREAIGEYEKAIALDPASVSLLTRLANAFVRCGMTDSAIKTYEEVVEFDVNNVGSLKQLGQLYDKKDDYDNARKCYQKILEIAPGEPETGQLLKNLDARATIKRSQWEDTTTYRTKLRDADEARELEIKGHFARSEDDVDYLIQRAEEKLKTSPDDRDALRDLAEACARKGDLTRSLALLDKALALDPNDFLLRRKLFETKITVVEEKMKTKGKTAELVRKCDELRLEMVTGEVLKYPTNLALRYDYGLLLKKAGRINEAIAEFQLSVKEPTRKRQSLNMLGLCFKEKLMCDLAVSQFLKALELTRELDDETKEIVYNLGSTYETMGDNKRAIEEYKKIYEVDITYRDIAGKMEAAYWKTKGEGK